MSGLVMDFISSPRDLYNVAMINKVTMQALTTRMVVRCAMFGGTRQYKCMQMLQKLMVKHSIYPPTPLRLVRLVNGKRCEFCNNESPRGQNNLHRYFNTSKAIRCGPFRITENPKPRQIRGSLGLFACYPCMTQVRHQSISGGWSYPCLTRRWHKLFLSASLDHRVHTKQTWSVNRELMHRIFSHPRVLAYPYQVRRFDTLGLRNDRINSLLGDQAGDIFPRDRTEIMQSCSLRDASGDLIGSLINHDNLRDLQQYLKKDDSRTIGYFIDRFVSEAPDRRLRRFPHSVSRKPMARIESQRRPDQASKRKERASSVEQNRTLYCSNLKDRPTNRSQYDSKHPWYMVSTETVISRRYRNQTSVVMLQRRAPPRHASSHHLHH